MYNTLKRLYIKTGNIAVLDNAIKKGWLTKEEKEQIFMETDTIETRMERTKAE